MRAALLALPLVFVLLAASIPDGDPDPQEVTRGQQLFETVCTGCHTLEPPPDSAPPMTHVVRHLKGQLETEEAFAEHVRSYVRAPDSARSLLPAMAIERFGLMGALPLDEEALADVAAYLWTLSEPGAAGEMRGMGHRGGMRGGEGMGMRHRGGDGAMEGMEGMEGHEGKSCPMHDGKGEGHGDRSGMGGGMKHGSGHGEGAAMGGADAMEGMEGHQGMSCRMHDGEGHGDGSAMGGGMKHGQGGGAAMGGMKGMGGEGMSCPCHASPDAPADSVGAGGA